MWFLYIMFALFAFVIVGTLQVLQRLTAINK